MTKANNKNGVKLFISNDQNTLIKRFIEDFNPVIPSTPFTPKECITSNKMLADFLLENITNTSDSGIAANLNIIPADQWIYSLYNILRQEELNEVSANKNLVWSKEFLPTHIINVLCDIINSNNKDFKELLDWFKSGNKDAIDPSNSNNFIINKRVVSLSIHLSRIFFQWDLYRSLGEKVDIDNVNKFPWLFELYIRLVDKLGLPPLAYLIENIDKTENVLSANFRYHCDSPIFFFGHILLEPTTLQLINLLSKKFPIRIFIFSPAPDLWRLNNSSSITNPILNSLGKDLQKFAALFKSNIENDEFIILNSPSKKNVSLLETLKYNFNSIDVSKFEKTQLTSDDHSIEIEACYGPNRQVEVIHNIILSLLEKDDSLSLADILIVTPDIECFAPLLSRRFNRGSFEKIYNRNQYIKDNNLSVDDDFNILWGSYGTPVLPISSAYSITNSSSKILDGLITILQSLSDVISIKSIIDLLMIDPIRNAFDIDADQLPDVICWLKNSGMIRDNHQDDDSSHESIEWGLTRLAFGIVSFDNNDLQTNSKWVPAESVEGLNIVPVGNLFDFILKLLKIQKLINNPKSLTEWFLFLNNIIDLVMKPSEDESSHLAAQRLYTKNRIFSFLETYQSFLNSNILNSSLSLSCEAFIPILQAWFKKPFSLTRDLHAIRLTSLDVTTFEPHRVVILLGMDDGVVPRIEQNFAFDPLALNRKDTDYNGRSLDMIRVLNAVSTATEKLIISYTGFNEHSNETVPPSIVVNQLIDAISASISDDTENPHLSLNSSVKDRIVFHHPLQPFGNKAFSSNVQPRFIPFGFQPLVTPQASNNQNLADSIALIDTLPPINELSIYQFQTSIVDPCRIFSLLRVNFRDPNIDDEIEESRILELTTSQLRQLQRLFFEHSIFEQDINHQHVLNYLTESHHLAFGNLGKYYYNELIEIRNNVVNIINMNNTPNSSQIDINIDLTVNNIRIFGKIPNLFETTSNKQTIINCFLPLVDRVTLFDIIKVSILAEILKHHCDNNKDDYTLVFNIIHKTSYYSATKDTRGLIQLKYDHSKTSSDSSVSNYTFPSLELYSKITKAALKRPLRFNCTCAEIFCNTLLNSLDDHSCPLPGEQNAVEWLHSDGLIHQYDFDSCLTEELETRIIEKLDSAWLATSQYTYMYGNIGQFFDVHPPYLDSRSRLHPEFLALALLTLRLFRKIQH